MPRGILRAQRIEQVRREVGQIVRFGGQRLSSTPDRDRAPSDRRPRAGDAAAKSRLALQAFAVARQVHERGIVGQHGQGRRLRPRERCADRDRSSATRRPPGRRRCRRRAHARRTTRGSRPCRRTASMRKRKQRFADLGREIAPLAAARQSRELHGERAAAAHHAARPAG